MLEERLGALKDRVNALSYQNRQLIIWGRGEYASFVMRTLDIAEGLKVEAFTDDFSGGKVLRNLPVYRRFRHRNV